MSKALLLIDIQNDYFDDRAMKLYQPKEVTKNVQKLLRVFRQKNKPIFHIRHIFDQAISLIEYKKVAIKHTSNSFYHTDLLQSLKSRKITNLVISRITSHMCVDLMARATKDLVLIDAYTTRDLISLDENQNLPEFINFD